MAVASRSQRAAARKRRETTTAATSTANSRLAMRSSLCSSDQTLCRGCASQSGEIRSGAQMIGTVQNSSQARATLSA
jgi:hypothetical protein